MQAPTTPASHTFSLFLPCSNNFVLLKCIEEVAQKALAARGEQQQLRVSGRELERVGQSVSRSLASCPCVSWPTRQCGSPLAAATADALAQGKLALLTGSREAAAQPVAAVVAPPAAVGTLAPPSSPACTPPPARRAAALELELLRLEEQGAPGSPTQLLLPPWPGRADAAPAAAAAAHQRPEQQQAHEAQQRQAMPTSAELRRQLQEAMGGTGGSGGGGWSSGGNSAGSSGEKKPAAGDHHHLFPSPTAVTGQPELEARQELRQHQAVLQLKQGPALLRTCSAPGGLLASTAASLAAELGGSGAVPPESRFRTAAA